MAAQSKLKWRNASKENPGYTVWYATPERDENVLYVVRRKRGKRKGGNLEPNVPSTPSIWRVFMRSSPDEKLRTIFVADTLDGKEGSAKTFVQEWEEMICAAANLEPAPTP